MGIKLYISKFVESCSRGLLNYFSHMTLEKVSFLICFALGIVFLIAALAGAWRYYVTMFMCFIAAFLVTEEREH